MTIAFGDLNWLAIIVVAVAGYVFAAGWYGVWRVPWMTAAGLKPEMISATGTRAYISYAVSALTYFVAIFSLAAVMQSSGAAGAVDGLMIGVMLGVAFYGLFLINNHLYTMRSVKLMGIDLGPPLITLTLGGLVLGVWD